MKNKKENKKAIFKISELDNSIINELNDIESIASEINSNINKEIIDELESQQEILNEISSQQEVMDEVESKQEILDEISSQQEIMDVIESEQAEMLKELQPELDELKEREKILDEILQEENLLKEELGKHEAEINEIIVRSSEVLKDIVNPQEYLKEMNELINKSDKTFYSFAESIRIENEINNEELEVAPDVLKESVLGKVKRPIKKTSFFKNYEWLLNPKPVSIGLTGAALVILLLIPFLKDDKIIDNLLYPEDSKTMISNVPENDSISSSTSFEADPPNVKTYNNILLVSDGTVSKTNNDSKSVENTADIIDQNIIEDYNTIAFRSAFLSNDKLISLNVLDGKIQIGQSDDLERTIKVFQNEKLVIEKRMTDFNDQEGPKILSINLDKGNYKVIVSFLEKELLNKNITIE